MVNNDQITLRSYGVEDEFLINCASSCSKEIAEYPAYGTVHYSMDSALCVSAFHQGALNARGGDVVVQLKDGLIEYDGSTRNGLASNDRPGNVNIPSITF